VSAQADRDARKLRVTWVLQEERGEGYAAGFRAAIAAVVRYATELAGVRGLTQAAHQSLVNCIAELIRAARAAAQDELIPWELATELREHATAELEAAVARLGRRGER